VLYNTGYIYGQFTLKQINLCRDFKLTLFCFALELFYQIILLVFNSTQNSQINLDFTPNSTMKATMCTVLGLGLVCFAGFLMAEAVEDDSGNIWFLNNFATVSIF
jgi:hypothetical protein